jgi:flagellum-specific peptidoglycan hydrolase FlgJ
MTLLADFETALTPQTLYLALRQAAPGAVGCELSRASLLVLLAHVAEETGWKSCHANNLGNVKHVTGDDHDYVQFRCSEIVNGKEVSYDPPDPTTSFRAYATLTEGCIDYLQLLRKRFYLAWPAVLNGDPALFCHLLKAQHYYTADEAKYTANVVWLNKHLDAMILQDTPEAVTVADAPPVLPEAGQPTPPDDLPPADA